jgi:hypothetical protein
VAHMLGLEAERHPLKSRVSGQGSDLSVVLRLSGGKPLRIRGDLLAECTSWSVSAPAWHELEIYGRDNGDIAVALRCCRGNFGEGDIFHARIFPTRDEALSWLQELDPSADLSANIDASDRRISTIDIALRAAALRQHTDRVERQYRSMIGELLYQFCMNE